MEHSFPEDAVLINGKYDRVFNAADWARVIEKYFQTGVHPVPEDGLHVAADGESMTISIAVGAAFVRGHTYINDAAKPFEINTADANYNRKDIIVIRQSNTDRQTFALYRPGVPGSAPEPPALIRNSDEYEIKLAEILVRAGVQTITQADITDTRADTDVCGLSVIPMYHVDLSTFYDQYNTRKEQEFAAMDEHLAVYNQWWDAYTNTGETTWTNFVDLWHARITSFDDWFGTIKGNIHDEIYFDMDNWAYRAGEAYTTTVNPDGSISKVLKSKHDGAVIAETLTKVRSGGSITTKLTVPALNLHVLKTTTVNVDGSITAEMEEYNNVYG